MNKNILSLNKFYISQKGIVKSYYRLVNSISLYHVLTCPRSISIFPLRLTWSQSLRNKAREPTLWAGTLLGRKRIWGAWCLLAREEWSVLCSPTKTDFPTCCLPKSNQVCKVKLAWRDAIKHTWPPEKFIFSISKLKTRSPLGKRQA